MTRIHPARPGSEFRVRNVEEQTFLSFPRDDLLRAADLCAEAFFESPHIRYFFPDRSRRKGASAGLFEMRIRYALLYGEVHITTSELEGLAAWIPAACAQMTMWRQIRAGGIQLRHTVGASAVGRMTNVACHNDVLRRRNAPSEHWLLSILAVRPSCQHQGFASHLLTPKLHESDEKRITIYLETTEDMLVPLYEHYGFIAREHSPVPTSDLLVCAMTRSPR